MSVKRMNNFLFLELKLVDHDLVEVDKDVAVRKTIKSVFNKTEEDFAGDLERLRDYEEKVEDLIHNLINEIDVDETKLYIEKYKSENAKLISKNQHKISVSQQAESRDIQKQQDLKITQDEEFMVNLFALLSSGLLVQQIVYQRFNTVPIIKLFLLPLICRYQ